jgi:hypothetical protein
MGMGDKCIKRGDKCFNKIFRRKFCKKHYFEDIKLDLLKVMRNLYKIPNVAYADIDFTGKGHITEEDFFNTLLIYKLKYPKDELKDYLDKEN